MGRTLRAFCVGSSLPVTFWPLIGLAVAAHRNGAVQLDFSMVGIVFPLVFGLTNAVSVRILDQTVGRMFLVGAIMGLGLASVGTFLLDIPGTVYQLEGSARYSALVLGPVFYGAVWAIPLRYLNLLFELHRGSGSEGPSEGPL